MRATFFGNLREFDSRKSYEFDFGINAILSLSKQIIG